MLLLVGHAASAETLWLRYDWQKLDLYDSFDNLGVSATVDSGYIDYDRVTGLGPAEISASSPETEILFHDIVLGTHANGSLHVSGLVDLFGQVDNPFPVYTLVPLPASLWLMTDVREFILPIL